MFLAKGTILALVVAAVLVEGSPVNSDGSETTTEKFVPGGLTPMNTNDSKVQELAKFSLTQLQSSLGTSEKPEIVKITKASKQVVSGMMYHITYEVSVPNGGKKSCTVKVWEQPWISPDPKVTDVTCDDKPSS